jgi:hypothetical protein
MKKLPNIGAQHIPFELKYRVHKHGIITPSILFKTKDIKWNNILWLPKNGALKWNEEAPQGTCTR